jgi:hypothetical protein
MACKKCGTSNKNCGCTDTPYTTVKTYTCPPDVGCPVPSPCAEYNDSACTVYSGADIWELGGPSNRSVQSIIQQLIIKTGNFSDCADPCSTCQSTWNVFLADATSTTLTIAWDASATAVTYQVEYQLLPEDGCTLGTWLLVASQTTQTTVLTGLTASTSYLVRVNSICASGNCYSVTLKVNTTV